MSECYRYINVDEGAIRVLVADYIRSRYAWMKLPDAAVEDIARALTYIDGGYRFTWQDLTDMPKIH